MFSLTSIFFDFDRLTSSFNEMNVSKESNILCNFLFENCCCVVSFFVSCDSFFVDDYIWRWQFGGLGIDVK